jgi:hypothetical protein
MPRIKRKRDTRSLSPTAGAEPTTATPSEDPPLDPSDKHNIEESTINASSKNETSNFKHNDGDGNDHAVIVEEKTENVSLVEKNAAALEIQQGSTSDTISDDKLSSEQFNQVQELLIHRKLLLNRLRQGRAAAQKRLAASPSTLTDAEEIAAHRDSARRATMLARKAKLADAESTSAAPLLRRGAAVANRTTAAQSTFGGPTLAGIKPSASLPPSVTLKNEIPAAAAGPVMKKATMPLKQHSLKAPLPGSGVAARGTTTISGLTATFAQPPDSVVQPTHNRAQRPEVNRALRDRKKTLETKLVALYQNRLRNQQQQKPPQTSIQQQTTLDTTLQAVLMGPNERALHPRRRRTHWDCVVDEMKWLATDFMQERKWKHATSKLLAGSCESSYGRKKAVQKNPLRTINDRITKNTFQTNKEVVIVGSEVQPEKRSAQPAEMKIDAEERSRTTASDAVVYVELLAEDLERAKNVAKIMSSMVLELVTATINAATSSTGNAHTKALDGHLISRKASVGETIAVEPLTKANGTSSSDIATPSVQHGVADPSVVTYDASSLRGENDLSLTVGEKEAALQQISERIDVMLQKVKPRVKRNAKDIPGLAVGLTNSQNAALQMIEDLWGRVGAGAALSGPLSSGKTILTCAALWKHRHNGPQLVVCSELSMVRHKFVLSATPSIYSFALTLLNPDKMATRTGPF